MTGQKIIDMCKAIIKRQDISTDLLLMYINQQRKNIFRSNYLYKIQSWVTGFVPTDGFITITNLKQARYVEWNPDADNNQATENPEHTNGITQTRKKKLLRLNNIQEAYEFINDVDAEGEPIYYIVMQGGIKIIPAPTQGVINIFGEWNFEDFENTASSLAKEDTLTKELSDVIIYNSCAEYLDFLEEHEKADLWRNKSAVLLQQYITEIKRQMTDDRNLMDRDPFGNLGLNHGWRYNQQYIYPSGGGSGGNYSTMSQQEVEDTFDTIVNGGNNP